MADKEKKKRVEMIWRKEKYKVMYYDQNQYNYIRNLMRHQFDDLEELQRIMDETYKGVPSAGSKLNSIQHMWGYFKKKCTDDEKKEFLALCQNVELNEQAILLMLKNMADAYEVRYLQESTILQQPPECSRPFVIFDEK